MLERFMSSDPYALRREQRRRDAAEHVGEVRESLRETEREWDGRIGGWAGRRRDRAGEVEQEHVKEICEFEQHWADPEYLVVFRKPSPKLLLLRVTEKRLALLQQFERAKGIKAEADRLERDEAEEAQKRAVAAMKMEYANMEARHERELAAVHGFTEMVRERFEKNRDRVIQPLQMLITRFTTIAQAPVVRERKKERVFLEPIWPESPRPVKNAQSARIQSPGHPLGLAGISMRKYIKVNKVDPKKDSAKKKKVSPLSV
jgi:hypothetical protein